MAKKQVSVHVDAIPLQSATLCQDCHMITSAKNGHCPVCGSTALMNIGQILERENNESN